MRFFIFAFLTTFASSHAFAQAILTDVGPTETWGIAGASDDSFTLTPHNLLRTGFTRTATIDCGQPSLNVFRRVDMVDKPVVYSFDSEASCLRVKEIIDSGKRSILLLATDTRKVLEIRQFLK